MNENRCKRCQNNPHYSAPCPTAVNYKSRIWQGSEFRKVSRAVAERATRIYKCEIRSVPFRDLGRVDMLIAMSGDGERVWQTEYYMAQVI